MPKYLVGNKFAASAYAAQAAADAAAAASAAAYAAEAHQLADNEEARLQILILSDSEKDDDDSIGDMGLYSISRDVEGALPLPNITATRGSGAARGDDIMVISLDEM